MPLSKEDIITINRLLQQVGDIWEHDDFKSIKKKIKTYYRSKCDECCYCRKSFIGEFNMVIDIEHILPKSKFRELIFELFNLNISCKRCNMQIKKEKVDFLVNPIDIMNNLHDTTQYLFIHPNFDNYYDHIDYIVNIHNQKKTIKYLQLTDKGNYTYEYFQLKNMEINILNEAQGINASKGLSESIPKGLIDETIVLLNSL